MCLAGFLYCCVNNTLSFPQRQEKRSVPLTGAHAFVKVVDFCAEVTLKQRYENKESNPIEAVYEFPLDAKAAICDFYAEIDNRKIVGQLKEKEQAINTYDDAISSGHGAYLLKEEKPNQFSCSVGNLPPGKEVLIVITYVTELEFEDGKLQLVLPANPYAPDGRVTNAFELPSNSSGKYSEEVGNGLKINVDFEMTSPIRSISSPTNPITFEFGTTNKQANVKLSSSSPLSKDFLLEIGLLQSHLPVARIEQSPEGELTAMVALYPDLDEDRSPIYSETIFLVDRSGSMSGSRIRSVKDTLQIFLRSLPEGSMFNIIGFGSSQQSLFYGSVEYNDTTLAQAIAHVNIMQADLGGTNILNPLKDLFRTPPKEGIPRQVFVLTDGEVDDPQACIDEVRLHANTTRVFAFGIGNEASRHLIRGMAKAGEGRADFINTGDNVDEKVLKQLSYALKPSLTNMKVDWGTLKVEQTPFRLPPVFAGGRVIVYGLLSSLPDSASNVTLTGKSGSNTGQATVTLDPSNVSKGKLITRLSRKSLIRDLEEGRSYMHDEARGLSNGISQKQVNDQIIKCSIKSGVISKLTAFVAVEKRSDASEGEMVLRKVSMLDDTPQRPQLPSNQMNISSQLYGSVPVPTSSVPGNMFGGTFGGSRTPSVGASFGSATNTSTNNTFGRVIRPVSTHGNAVNSNPFGGSPVLSSPYGHMPHQLQQQQQQQQQQQSFASFDFFQAQPSTPTSSFAFGSVSPASILQPQAAMPPSYPSYAQQAASPLSFGSAPLDLFGAPPNSAPAAYGLAPSPVPASATSSFFGAAYAPAVSSPSSVTTNSDRLREIIKKQKANGSFTPDVVSMLTSNWNLENLKAEISSKIGSCTDELLALAVTRIVILYLESKMPDQKISWSLIAKKANSWFTKESERLKITGIEQLAAGLLIRC